MGQVCAQPKICGNSFSTEEHLPYGGAAWRDSPVERTARLPKEWKGEYDADFLNGMLLAVWPLVTEFSKTIIKQSVEPAVKVALGSTMVEQLGFAFELDDYHLGDNPVQFGLLTIGEIRRPATEDLPEARNLTMRTPMKWHGDLCVYINVAGMKVGVTGISLEGDLFMEFVHMIPKPPLFQGARGCFINPPKVHLDFDAGAMQKLVTFGPVKRGLLQAIRNELAGKLVVPNRMGVRLDPKQDILYILKPRPAGILLLTVVKAEGLLAMDKGLLGKAHSSDPYVTVTCGAARYQSPTMKQTTSPVFGFEVCLPIHFPMEQVISFELMDEDLFQSNDFLGRLEVLVAALIETGGREVGYEVQDIEGRPGERGTLYLTAEWRPLLHVPPQVSDDQSLVFVGIYGAKHLPPAPEGTTYKVLVQCTNRQLLNVIDKKKKPRETGKALPKVIEGTADELKYEQELWEKRRGICERYKMTKEDMAELLDVDVTEIDTRAQPHQVINATWNAGFEFLVSKAYEAELTIRLKAFKVGSKEKDEEADGDNMEAPKGNSSVVSAAGNIFSMIATTVKAGVNRVVDDGVMAEWTIKVADIIQRDKDPFWRLPVEGKRTILDLNLQARGIGPLTSTFDR